ncbi:hypothetical protein PF001_g22933 [Phytophthora fragariae]|nr:hypothetical protein PF006_g23549 [Phytophthora fragariae]KAE9283263.1 hypothetical protein PF001_g22933 [Phytophthora fragariae]
MRGLGILEKLIMKMQDTWQCHYVGVCTLERSFKRGGERHTLCDMHRKRQNTLARGRYQRIVAEKKAKQDGRVLLDESAAPERVHASREQASCKSSKSKRKPEMREKAKTKRKRKLREQDEASLTSEKRPRPFQQDGPRQAPRRPKAPTPGDRPSKTATLEQLSPVRKKRRDRHGAEALPGFEKGNACYTSGPQAGTDAGGDTNTPMQEQRSIHEVALLDSDPQTYYMYVPVTLRQSCSVNAISPMDVALVAVPMMPTTAAQRDQVRTQSQTLQANDSSHLVDVVGVASRNAARGTSQLSISSTAERAVERSSRDQRLPESQGQITDAQRYLILQRILKDDCFMRKCVAMWRDQFCEI